MFNGVICFPPFPPFPPMSGARWEQLRHSCVPQGSHVARIAQELASRREKATPAVAREKPKMQSCSAGDASCAARCLLIRSGAGEDRLRLSSSPNKEGRIMKKVTSTLIAAVAALTLSGGAFAQAGGGSSGGGTSGSTASPANQVNGTTNGYGTPGMTNSDSGKPTGSPNSGLPSSNSGTAGISAPATNNTLATPSTKSPAAGQ